MNKIIVILPPFDLIIMILVIASALAVIVALTLKPSAATSRTERVGMVCVGAGILWFMLLAWELVESISYQYKEPAVAPTGFTTIICFIGAFGLYRLSQKYGTPASRKR